MKEHTRCPHCGLRLPKEYLTEHIAIMHPGKSVCNVCGARLLYNQYSYHPFCPNCERDRIETISEEKVNGETK